MMQPFARFEAHSQPYSLTEAVSKEQVDTEIRIEIYANSNAVVQTYYR